MYDRGAPPTAPSPLPGVRADGLFQTRYREVTLSAIVFGVAFGAVMNAAITYAGLKIGFTINASAIAAVLGFGMLRGLLRRGSILEVNITQTVASAVNQSNSGIIFTVPVLLLFGLPLSFDESSFWLITLACMGGAVLGCVFIVPLRKQMIDIERLRFPSPTAVAAILKSPGAGPKKSIVLVIGVLLGALLYLPAGLPDLRRTVDAAELDALVTAGEISAADAELARRIDAWIAAAAAPPEVLDHGRAAAALREARLSGDEDAIGAARPRLETVRADGVSDALALAALEAHQGERDWDSLRSGSVGWPLIPLPGYSSLGWRMQAEPAAEGDGLSLRVDRDRDGKPDLILSNKLFDLGRLIRLPDEMQLAFAIAPFALGAGYLTGRAGLMVLAGGVLAYLILNPISFWLGWVPQSVRPHEVPGFALSTVNRPLGIGLLLGGALMGILSALPAMREAMRSVLRAGRPGERRDELGFKELFVTALLGMAAILVATELLGGGVASDGTGGLLGGVPPAATKAIVAAVAIVWIWFAGIIIVQCAGMTDWSPISGIALLTVVLVMLLGGKADVLAAVMLGAALCVAIGCAADMMGDLKTGFLVGAQPRRQQILEIATIIIGPVVAMSTLVLIAQVNLKQTGIPIGPGTDTVAPQAQALEAVITGVQGGEMPYALYGLGAVLGLLLGLGSFPGLGVLVGLSVYLPVVYIMTYGLGCMANMGAAKIMGRAWAEEWGVPLCAGLIVGEAMVALVLSAIVLVGG